jgi:hypothetical protein
MKNTDYLRSGEDQLQSDAVRRVEVVGLVGMSLLLAIQYALYGLAPAAAMLWMAVTLLPRERVVPAATREEARMELLNQLQAEAMDLRARYMTVRSQPLTLQRAEGFWQVRREITVWLETCRSRLRFYPEFAGIYDARRGSGGIIDDLDRCLSCFSELKRLTSLSMRLRLPI